MSTTGWRVGTSVTSQPSSPQRGDSLGGARRPRGPRPRARSSERSRRPRRDARAGAPRAGGPRWRRTRPRAASAPPPGRSASRVRRLRSGSARARRPAAARRRAPPRPPPAARRRPRRAARRAPRPRTCRRPCGSSSPRSRASPTTTSSQSAAIGLSALPVTSHFGPGNACAASSVSGVSPSWLTSTSRSASGGSSRNSSASTPLPVVWAAWNEVPQPTATTRPSGKPQLGRHLREPLGLRRDRRSRLLACHSAVYSMAAWGSSSDSS